MDRHGANDGNDRDGTEMVSAAMEYDVEVVRECSRQVQQHGQNCGAGCRHQWDVVNWCCGGGGVHVGGRGGTRRV